MPQVAHVRKIDGAEQTIREHLLAVKNIAEEFGAKVGMKHMAGLAGMLHDLGKYSDAFQDYIAEAVANPESPPRRGSVDHSTAGGKLMHELFHQDGENQYTKLLAEIIGNAIISHHSYLHDYLDDNLESKYLRRVKEKKLPQYDQVKNDFFEKVMAEEEFHDYVNKATEELQPFVSKAKNDAFEIIMFLTKFIFSILIDADRTDSMLFEENKSYEPIEGFKRLFEQYYDNLMKKIRLFEDERKPNDKIGTLRSEMSEQCENHATKPSGIYTLSIPTGGGKTLASLRYALKHVLTYKKERIIYIVPYTTIIEQNAAEVRKILGDRVNILEFHSNVVEGQKESDSDDDFFRETYKVNLSKDSWDSPIIFTTMVQFLNVFFDSGTRSIRRLHNLANSVIIFDEIQKVPTNCVSLFNKAVNFLKNYCHTTSLLCTATQPSLNYVKNSLEINTDGEIIKNLPQIVEAFKRVNIFDYTKKDIFDTGTLAFFVKELTAEKDGILVILNTKTVVRKLFEKLKDNLDEEIYLYHLSTSMCAAHRKNIIRDMKDNLENGKKVICVSTQLIEAGVDISFRCVIRSLAGLDSIAQAAGRCNRHGEFAEPGEVYIIDHREEKLSQLKEINFGKIITQKLLIDIHRGDKTNVNDILSNEMMTRYFQEFYTEFQLNLDYPVKGHRENMVQMLTDTKADSAKYRSFINRFKRNIDLFNISSMHTAAKYFQAIESQTIAVIVPCGEGRDIISQLISAEMISDFKKLMKRAQQYTVNLFDNEMRNIQEVGGVYGLYENTIYIIADGFYDEEYGIKTEGDAKFDDFIW